MNGLSLGEQRVKFQNIAIGRSGYLKQHEVSYVNEIESCMIWGDGVWQNCFGRSLRRNQVIQNGGFGFALSPLSCLLCALGDLLTESDILQALIHEFKNTEWPDAIQNVLFGGITFFHAYVSL